MVAVGIAKVTLTGFRRKPLDRPEKGQGFRGLSAIDTGAKKDLALGFGRP